MTKGGTLLIIFAWAVETVGVAGGVINSNCHVPRRNFQHCLTIASRWPRLD
jgi:hypothetical protein